jgi:steroid Delta-isomerase
VSEGAQRFKLFWEQLTREKVAGIGQYYTEDAYFRDPFNEVRGIPELRRIFDHMFEQLHEPRFKILEVVQQGESAFFVWDFTFRMKSYKPDVVQTIHGSSHVRFAPDGRVAYHRDYWDAANELYAKLPVIGALMRWLARRMA